MISWPSRAEVDRAVRHWAKGRAQAQPVPVDVLIYTPDEWNALLGKETRFAHVLESETVWVWPEPAP